MLIMSINQRLNFGFGRLHKNQIQEFVSAVLISWRKVCIFQTGIGILEVYLIGYQSLRKLDCLQIIRKSLFSLKNKNLKNDNIIWDLRKGLISERKHPWVKIFNTITQLNEYDSLSSLFRQNIYNDFLSCVMIHLLYLPWKSLKSGSHPPMVKNAFSFTLKALFVLKIFEFLSWFFGHVEKTAWLDI